MRDVLVLEILFGAGPSIDRLVAAGVHLIIGLVVGVGRVIDVFDRLVVGVDIGLGMVGISVEVFLHLVEFFLFDKEIGQFGHIVLSGVFVESYCLLAGVDQGGIAFERSDGIEVL